MATAEVTFAVRCPMMGDDTKIRCVEMVVAGSTDQRE